MQSVQGEAGEIETQKNTKKLASQKKIDGNIKCKKCVVPGYLHHGAKIKWLCIQYGSNSILKNQEKYEMAQKHVFYEKKTHFFLL